MTLKIGWLHEGENHLGTWLHEADDWHGGVSGTLDEVLGRGIERRRGAR